MRALQSTQMNEVDIAKIKFDPKSRDDIPKILRGLQYIYVNTGIREEIFDLLEKKIAPKVNKNNGRPGMELWKIFVMGVLRLDLNCDYDRIHHLANHDTLIRQMLGHVAFDSNGNYQLQTIKDNVSLLTPELLEEINQVIVKAGHILLKKKENEVLRGRCDSFVVETQVHFPTDINLLFDSMRKVMTLIARLCDRYELSSWRQERYNVIHLKKLMRIAQNKKHSSAKTEEQKKRQNKLIIESHQDYINVAEKYLEKSSSTLNMLEKQGLSSIPDVTLSADIKTFVDHAIRQINQIKRRVIFGETIPHDEKVFSLFQPHTEWIMKGKAGVPVELGVRVCILEDQYQFILHHKVMEKQVDNVIAIPIIKETKVHFPDLSTCSFDKGFHSPENQEELSKLLKVVALKRKGKLSQKARLIEKSDEFCQAHFKHSAVESAINALEVHGLDKCLDHGIIGFKRYVALAIVARNIHRIGDLLKNREQKIEKRNKKKYFNRNANLKLAA